MPDNHCRPIFAGLDILTPYGTMFRYETLPADVELDRQALYELIRSFHEFVIQRLS
jgi:hypothetical protein